MRFSILLFTFGLAAIFQWQCHRQSEPCTEFTGPAGGCGDFMVFRYSCDRLMAVQLTGDLEKLGIATSEKTFELGNTPELFAQINQFSRAGRDYEYYCNDVLSGITRTNVWNAVSGTARIWISTPDVYRITVVLENAVFEDKNGDTITLEALTFDDVLVGWEAG